MATALRHPLTDVERSLLAQLSACATLRSDQLTGPPERWLVGDGLREFLDPKGRGRR